MWGIDSVTGCGTAFCLQCCLRILSGLVINCTPRHLPSTSMTCSLQTVLQYGDAEWLGGALWEGRAISMPGATLRQS